MRRLLDWLFGLLAPPAPVPPPAPVAPGDLSAAIVAAMNAERVARNLPALRVDARLTKAAGDFAAEIARRDTLTHFGVTGSTPWSRIASDGYRWAAAGEDAEGAADAGAIVSLWMASPPHRANVLGDFSDAGAAEAISPTGNPYAVADFARPA